ncbi:hypothetical protein BLA29_007223 [Euroglyphus maynei]|uniref:Uncharacterized protein n=1 Tax=Euroglyphus maynei TaxID=6958 RepID=A0A1Y3BEY5_EURMA|nr:hypothetical protein BLA29_007223 [Euroglyphus maynei]
MLWLAIWHPISLEWCWYASSGSYQFSAFIFAVKYYLITKQKSLQKKMHRFYIRLIREKRIVLPERQYEFVKMNQTFVKLQKEIVINDQQLARFLSISFTVCSLALTYLTCVLFLASMPIQFIILYVIIYVAHLLSLSTFIFYGSQIEKINRNFLHYNRKCLGNEHQFVKNKCLLKHETVTSTMLESPIGIMLMNGTVITSKTQVDVC